MKFSKVETSLRDHPKAAAAGPAAMGVWLGALLYIRDHLTDGFVPFGVVEGFFGGGKANVRHAQRLVEVGLFERVEGGFVLCRYAIKNDTKADVERAMADARDRMAKRRMFARTSSEPPPNDVGVFGRTSGERSPDVPPSPSPSQNPDLDPDPTRAREGPTGQLLPRDADLTPRRREIAEGIRASSGRNLDATHEWAAFVAHVRETAKISADWDESWRRWLLNAAKFAKRDALRRQAGRVVPQQGYDPDAPWMAAARKAEGT